jgi:hypothetical protein
LRRASAGARLARYTQTLVAVGGLFPLAVMLALLFAAVWLCDARV